MFSQISKKKRFSDGERSSAAIIGSNDDLLTEIFVLLPVKSVVRFKSVNKPWRLLISGEFFTRLHVILNGRGCVKTQHPFILGDVYGRSQFFICHPTLKHLVRVSLPRTFKQQRYEHVKIVQSMNGLLLLSLKAPGEDRIDYVVFNPTTQQYRFIHLDGYRPNDVCLIFNPSKLDHYKLVMSTSAIPRFSVYDSATHQWSHGKDSPFIGDALGFSISGSLHHNLIVGSIRLGDTRHTNPNLIRIPESGAYSNYIFESNEYLNVLQLQPLPGEYKIHFRVGAMVDDEWVICKKAVLNFGSFDTRKFRLLGMMRDERIEDSTFLFHVHGRLLIYRFCDDDLKVIVDYRSDYFYVDYETQFQNAHPFVYTFAPV